MKAYKVEILILDFEGMSKEETAIAVNKRIDCLNGDVVSVVEADIGEWSDDHTLDDEETFNAEYIRLFGKPFYFVEQGRWEPLPFPEDPE